MQAKKRKEKRTLLIPQKEPLEIWKNIYQMYHDEYGKAIKYDNSITTEQKNRHFSFVKEIYRLNNEKSADYIQKAANISYCFLVRPYLPWDKLRPIQKELQLDDTTFEQIIFYLKPCPYEKLIIPAETSPLQKEFNKVCEKTLIEFNKKIRELSPLVKKLENLSVRDESYANFLPIQQTISKIKCVKAK